MVGCEPASRHAGQEPGQLAPLDAASAPDDLKFSVYRRLHRLSIAPLSGKITLKTSAGGALAARPQPGRLESDDRSPAGNDRNSIMAKLNHKPPPSEESARHEPKWSPSQWLKPQAQAPCHA